MKTTRVKLDLVGEARRQLPITADPLVSRVCGRLLGVR